MSTDTRVKIVGLGKLQVFATCSVTGEQYAVTVDFQAWKRWKNGAMVQDAFPELSADQREFLKTGTTPAEWNAWFGPEE